uniref:TRAF-type domain-containing protein n=1 Tax=Macrostomum lignano TaxID=282301 RepID=A0A1I8JNR8_9PLAT
VEKLRQSEAKLESISAESSAKDQQLLELQRRLDEADCWQSKLEAKETELTELRQQIANKKAENAQKIHSSENRATAAEAEAEIARRNVADLQGRLEVLKRDLEDEKDAYRRKLEERRLENRRNLEAAENSRLAERAKAPTGDKVEQLQLPPRATPPTPQPQPPRLSSRASTCSTASATVKAGTKRQRSGDPEDEDWRRGRRGGWSIQEDKTGSGADHADNWRYGWQLARLLRAAKLPPGLRMMGFWSIGSSVPSSALTSPDGADVGAPGVARAAVGGRSGASGPGHSSKEASRSASLRRECLQGLVANRTCRGRHARAASGAGVQHFQAGHRSAAFGCCRSTREQQGRTRAAEAAGKKRINEIHRSFADKDASSLCELEILASFKAVGGQRSGLSRLSARHHLVLAHKRCNFWVGFDGDWTATYWLSGKYRGKLEGLAGDCDDGHGKDESRQLGCPRPAAVRGRLYTGCSRVINGKDGCFNREVLRPCIADACSAEGALRKKILCTSFYLQSRRCARHHKPLSWRHPKRM